MGRRKKTDVTKQGYPALEMEAQEAKTAEPVTNRQNLALLVKAFFNVKETLFGASEEDGMEDNKKKPSVQDVRCESCGHLLWKDRGAQLEIKEGRKRILLRAKLQDVATMECSCGFIRPIE